MNLIYVQFSPVCMKCVNMFYDLWVKGPTYFIELQQHIVNPNVQYWPTLA